MVSTRGESTPVISFERVSRWYGPILGLNKVSVHIEPGVTGLLGPNGAGKSTFMKLVTGQIHPSAGRVEVFGETVWDNPRLMRRLGYCPEIDNFYESMTGLQFVTLMTRLHGFSRSEARERAERALVAVRLEEAKDRRLSRYSKGMRQKCKLAQALAHDAELLVLDEPLTGTDPVSRRHLIDLVRKLAEDDGVNILVSSHVLHEIEEMTRTMLLIDHGRVLAEGGVRDVRDLIDDHPHRIRVKCDRARDLAAVVVRQDWASTISLGDHGVEIETHQPADCYRSLPKLALDAGIRLTSVESPDNNMESVFRYLVAGGPRTGPKRDT